MHTESLIRYRNAPPASVVREIQEVRPLPFLFDSVTSITLRISSLSPHNFLSYGFASNTLLLIPPDPPNLSQSLLWMAEDSKPYQPFWS